MSARPAFWQARGLPALLLLPLAMLFAVLRRLHLGLYRSGLRSVHRAPVPVLVVGNLTVGGTGKSPLVAEIARRAQLKGMSVGVVSRGHGGGHRHAVLVTPDADPAFVGDEPLMLARELGVPVCVARRRADAVARLLGDTAMRPDLVIADDGLQHHAMARDIELLVVDGGRGFGNRWLLPAGPLREPLTRLAGVDGVAIQLGADTAAPDGELRRCLLRHGVADGAIGSFRLLGETLRRVADGRSEPLQGWRDRRVHAVAGIGNPRRFFDTLRASGLSVLEHAFEDHHVYRESDLRFGDDRPIVSTSKDVVKLERMPAIRERLYELPVRAALDATLQARLDTLLDRLWSHRVPQAGEGSRA